MAISPGSRVGPYEVTAPLGEGGMGIVFRGRDSRLQRDVALKLLPDLLAPLVPPGLPGLYHLFCRKILI